MKLPFISSICSLIVALIITSCNNAPAKTEKKEPKLKEETVTYTVDSLRFKSYIVYDENMEGKRPAVLVIHEWWGLNDYAKRRAKMLAELGYIAMAVDMYGNDRMGNDPAEAQNLSTPYFMHPDMSKLIFDAALEQFKKNPLVDENKIGGIGYCFGGGVLLNIVRLGEPLKGIVTFHGIMPNVPANKELTNTEILVCNGGADPFVPEDQLNQFKKQMDSIGKKYTVINYPGALHAFSNPNATALGEKFKMPIAYNAAADTTSWKDMKDFFTRIFK